MVLEDSDKLIAVFFFQKRFHSALGKLSESFIGRSEYREGTTASQHARQIGCLGCCKQSLKCTCPLSDFGNCLGLWQHHFVDHVNGAVRRFDVGRDKISLIDLNCPT